MKAESYQVVIRARDLVVGFGDQVVLDQLSLDVRRGEILGVVGASAASRWCCEPLKSSSPSARARSSSSL